MSTVSGNLFSELYQEMEDQTVERALDYAELLGWSQGYREGVDDGGDDIDIDVDFGLDDCCEGDFSHSINYGVNPENYPQGDFSHSINYTGTPRGWNDGNGWYSEPSSFESVDSSAFDWDEVFSDPFTGEGVYQGEGLHRSGPTVIDASTNITYPGELFAS